MIKTKAHVDTEIEESDEVRRYISRRSTPLAELREKNAWQIQELKTVLYNAPVMKGIAIGISPRDDILNNNTRGMITKKIKGIFMNMRSKTLFKTPGIVAGSSPPPRPFMLVLVGEYSPGNFRWHYHGMMLCDNINVVMSIKHRLNKLIGRTITEQVKDTVLYTNYMFKSYECDTHKDFYDWDKKECYLEVIREL